MTRLVKVFNEKVIKYPYSIQELCEDFPRTTFPAQLTDDILKDFNACVVVETEQPNINYTQTCLEIAPEFLDGRWRQQWKIVQATEEEISNRTLEQAHMMRQIRDNLLKETVDRINPMRWQDMTEAQKNTWINYRKALLDLPQQAGYPWNIVLPEQPN